MNNIALLMNGWRGLSAQIPLDNHRLMQIQVGGQRQPAGQTEPGGTGLLGKGLAAAGILGVDGFKWRALHLLST